MARAAYRETAAVRALRQLVAFAEGDEQGDAVALTQLGRTLVELQASNTQFAKALGQLTAKDLRRLKHELRSFLHAAIDGPGAVGPKIEIHVNLLPLLGGLKQTRGRNRWLFAVSGSPQHVLRYHVATLLAVVGEDRLRLCPAPDCGKAFVKVGRREYCSERCQRRVFLSEYDPFGAQSRRKDRHGKTTR